MYWFSEPSGSGDAPAAQIIETKQEPISSLPTKNTVRRRLEEETSEPEPAQKIAKSADRFLLGHRYLDIYCESNIKVIFFTSIGWESVHGGEVQNDLKSEFHPSQ